MEIFGIKDNRIVDRLPLCRIYPQYTAWKDNLNYSSKSDDINRGFYVYVTERFIYARPIEFTLDMLRSGQNRNGYDLFFSKTIDVYDWDGHWVQKYETDAPFYSFVVDEAANVLYAETTDLETGGSIIKRYSMDDRN